MYSVSTFFRLIQYKRSVEKMWTQNTCIIHDVWRLLILSNEEKTNDYENFEKGMIYMKFWKKGGSREKGGGGNEIHAPMRLCNRLYQNLSYTKFCRLQTDLINRLLKEAFFICKSVDSDGIYTWHSFFS